MSGSFVLAYKVDSGPDISHALSCAPKLSIAREPRSVHGLTVKGQSRHDISWLAPPPRPGVDGTRSSRRSCQQYGQRLARQNSLSVSDLARRSELAARPPPGHPSVQGLSPNRHET